MTDNSDMTSKPVGRVRIYAQAGHGKGPVVATVALAAVLVAVLLLGGFGAVSALSAPRAANSTHLTKAPPTPVPGDTTPGTDDPVTPPDRDSDQTGVPTPEDEIYYIQEGDTLTELSARFGMSVDAIATYNAVRDVNVISEGAALRVPFIYVPPVG